MTSGQPESWDVSTEAAVHIDALMGLFRQACQRQGWTLNAERYHLTLTSAGRPFMHGWWGREETARDLLPVWVGSWGALPDARITLVDEETGRVLTTWPDEA